MPALVELMWFLKRLSFWAKGLVRSHDDIILRQVSFLSNKKTENQPIG